MTKTKRIQILCLLGAVTLLLSGCWTEAPVESANGLLGDQEPADQQEEVILPAAFTLPYDPDQTLDPVTCADGMQQVAGSLIYEGLFRLDRQLEPQPWLCQSYTYDAASLTYTFTLRSGVTFSDGSPLTAADAPVIEQFWQDYEAEFPKDSNAKAKNELELAKKMLKMTGKPYFFTGGMFDGEKLIALSLAEKCGDTLIIHIEKALYSYTGVYPALVQAFADAFGDGCQWINREDDAADKGLRTSNLQYGPARLAPKYRFDPQNELLNHVQAIPELKTERLTLSALTEADIPAYNALVLDADRNRWWGYDDVGGLGGRVEERSFFDVAKRDFENRQAVNFAVRLDGKLIGEAVLYRFDCRGGAELGCRIDKAYAGNGYGTEAFAAALAWGLKGWDLRRVTAKCFRENHPSQHMLAACMDPTGEDETYFYFEKCIQNKNDMHMDILSE